MFRHQHVNQEFRFLHENQQTLGPHPALDPPPAHRNEHQPPTHQYPNAELHPPYEHQLQSPDLPSIPEPEPPYIHEPQSQQDNIAIPLMHQHLVNQEFRFVYQNEQTLSLHPAPDPPPTDHNEHQPPTNQYPNAELHPPYEHQLQSPDLQSIPEPEPPYMHEPQSQQDNVALAFLQQPQYEDEFVHRDIAFTGYGVPQYMRWDLGVAEAPRAEYSEQPLAPGVVNEHQTLLLAPESTPALSNVEAESSESSDSNSEEDQTNRVELTRAQVLSVKEKAKDELRLVMLQKEGVAPTRAKCAKTIRKALKIGRISVIGQVKYKPFETKKVKEEIVSWMSNIRRLFKDYAIHNIQKDLSLRLPIEQQGAEVLHKKTLVLTLLNSLDFLHKFEYDDSGALVCYAFEAEWFVNMIVDVVFLNGLYAYVNAENFDSVFGLAGAASYNAISCFRNGTYSNIDASAEHFCDPYCRIVALIKLI